MYYIHLCKVQSRWMGANSGGDGILVGGVAEVSQVIGKIISSRGRGAEQSKKRRS